MTPLSALRTSLIPECMDENYVIRDDAPYTRLIQLSILDKSWPAQLT